jgi:hypothetical protein
MATISFKQHAQQQPKPKDPEPTQALAKVEAPAPPELASKFQSPQLEGEFGARDMRVPRLQLGAKSGKLTDEHPEWVGHFVYDGAYPLGKEIRLIVSKIRKYYEENLEFGSDEIPRRFDRMEDARAEGAVVRDVADIDLLLEVEADDSTADLALFEHSNKAYLPARYTVRSTAYGNTVGILLKDWAGWLKGDLSAGYYVMASEKRSNTMNSWFVPVLKTDGKVPTELRDEIREKFGV